MRKRRFFAIAAAAITLGIVFAVPAGAASNTVGLGSTQHPQATAAAAGSCVYSPIKPADSYKGIPPYNPNTATKPYRVRLYTTQGVITFRALTTKAPCTTNSFRFLAQHGYYDQTHCHRLTTQGIYVLQCGDPTGTGSGGPGYQFEDENLTGATYPAGTVAMANAGPNTNGSQFFFTWKDTTLHPDYTPFGVVVGGMDVLRKIAAAGEDDQNGAGDGYPNVFVKFLHVQIIPG
jgi:peptidyl-prolyl cis-trans isomerase B (cyclophilin B)